MTQLIPSEALDKHVALLGMTGAGKSSVIKTAIVEPDLEADRRVLIITPKDDWWGLRLSKSGKSKGYSIPIFGGWHGDYPLLVKDAALLAETYGTMKGSAIFCTSRLSSQDRARWFAAFAETLLVKNRGFVRVVIDEAHVFMPKQGGKGGGAIPLALHAGNELVSQGRSPGIRFVLASQRSAKLHNDSLTQCACLIAMMLMAPHDRDAVKEWIVDQADPEKGKEIIASLASLNVAQAWVWAPAAKMLKKIQFPWPKTFDSSKAADDDGNGPALAPINLDALKGKLATIEAESKANDPKALKAELASLRVAKADLEKQIEAKADEKAKPDKEAIAAAEARGFEQAKKKLRRETEKHAKDTIIAAMDALDALVGPIAVRLKEQLGTARKDRAKLDVEFTPSPASPAVIAAPMRPPVKAIDRPSVPRPSAVASDDGRLPGPQQRILNSLAVWSVMGHDQPSNAQVAWLAGYSPTSTGYTNPRGALKSQGLVDYPFPDHVILTDAGSGMADPASPPHDLLAHVLPQLSGPESRILAAVAAHYPTAITNAVAAQDAGYSESSTGYTNPRGALKTKELITYPQSGSVRAADWLFTERRAAA